MKSPENRPCDISHHCCWLRVNENGIKEFIPGAVLNAEKREKEIVEMGRCFKFLCNEIRMSHGMKPLTKEKILSHIEEHGDASALISKKHNLTI